MIRVLASAAIAIFWLGFYAGMHAESATCRAVHGLRPPLSWIYC